MICALALIVTIGTASAQEAVDVSQQADDYKRVGPQVATAGLSVEQQLAQQRELHSWLSREIPASALANPLTIQLTPEELAQINEGPAGGPQRVGVVKRLSQPVQVACDSAKGNRTARCSGDGALEFTEDGGFVWSRTIQSVGAAGIRAHLVDISIPSGAELFFYSPNGEAYGPFIDAGPHGDGELWLPSVMADTGVLVVKHHGPNGREELPAMTMTLTDVGHIDSGIFDVPVTTEGNNDLCPYNASCVQNQTCQNSGPATAAENAVAKMLWVSGCCLNICTGGLIADTDPSSETPYFLTANHCMSRGRDARNVEAFFQYEMSCGGTCPAGSFNPAPVSTKTLGANIRATGSSGDFTLLELSQSPPSGSTYLGWNNTPIAFSQGAALHRIHHPSGAPQAYSEHAVDTNIGTCTGASRGAYIYSDDVFGGTEGGSSGSPVVNSSGEIVGQLLGCCPAGGGNCNDVCNSNNHTLDGAFAHYYPNVASFLDNGGGTCSTTPTDCSDGVDNDCDGATDCADTNGAEDCSSDPACSGGTCSNVGDSCSTNSDCCSNKCKGSPNNKTCK
jgi:V8-like Glu-specific endopeptidase